MKLEDILNLIETEFFIVIRKCTLDFNYRRDCDYYIFENARIESASYPIGISIITDDGIYILSYDYLKFEDITHKNCISIYDYSEILDDFTQNLTPLPEYNQFKNELDTHIRKNKLKRLLC